MRPNVESKLGWDVRVKSDFYLNIRIIDVLNIFPNTIICNFNLQGSFFYCAMRNQYFTGSHFGKKFG